MKKILCLFSIMLLSSFLFAENRVRIETQGNRVNATIELAENEYIILNENFLYLLVESDEYDFIFDGYPEGQLKKSGETLYQKSLTLSGELVIKSGVEPGTYTLNVILGYQSCDEDGNCFIPVEVAESIEFGGSSNPLLVIILVVMVLFMVVLTIIIGRRKRRG